jgi:hypothetical protein
MNIQMTFAGLLICLSSTAFAESASTTAPRLLYAQKFAQQNVACERDCQINAGRCNTGCNAGSTPGTTQNQDCWSRCSSDYAACKAGCR